MTEFRVAMTDVYWQWEQCQVSTADLESFIGTISPVMDLHGQLKVATLEKQTS